MRSDRSPAFACAGLIASKDRTGSDRCVVCKLAAMTSPERQSTEPEQRAPDARELQQAMQRVEQARLVLRLRVARLERVLWEMR